VDSAGWVKELQLSVSSKIVLCIAANKCDLNDCRQVDIETGAGYADEIGALFFETSAKDNINVVDMFVDICREIPRGRVEYVSAPTSPNNNIDMTHTLPPPPSKTGGCC
jgi:GTPase SAR1 family protein